MADPHPEARNFLHLSDIHFRKPDTLDPDIALRHGLEQDIQRILPTLGHVDGILISGDIAFAGKVEEYETARTWLAKIAAYLNCDPSYVWCVPGNHDVDQSVHKELPLLLTVHDALRKSSDIDKDLADQLAQHPKVEDQTQESKNGSLLFQPLKNYNVHFASRFDCPTSPKSPWWEDSLQLNDGSLLKLRGLNSAIISDRNDNRQTHRVIVGSLQTQYLPENNVVYLTLCHHPPDWLVDEEDVHEVLTARSHLQLLGHKHNHRHEVTNGKLRLYSGAVQPVRAEQVWDPRYYFISLRVESQDTGKRSLVVDVYARVWSKTEREFVREAATYDGHCKVETLPLPDWRPTDQVPQAELPSSQNNVIQSETPSINSMNQNRKKLVHRFMTLPFLTQISIMEGFQLVTEDEKASLPDIELFAAFFGRAREKDLIDKVWDAIENAENKVET